jgi:hypothetical protein
VSLSNACRHQRSSTRVVAGGARVHAACPAPSFRSLTLLALGLLHLGLASAADPASDAATQEPRNYYVDRRSYGTSRDPEPPRYVRPLAAVDPARFAPYDWLDVGADFRARFEYRAADHRRPRSLTDTPLLLRTRAYLGVRDVLDPLRLHFEVQDSRRYFGEFPRDDRDFNEVEFIQAALELHFADALGADRPLRLQGGRLAFEYLDRRLLARNEWRNTSNNFQGARLMLGQERNDWQVELLAVQPLERRLDDFDRALAGQHVFAAIGHWRRWSRVITLEPYYLMFEQNARDGRPARHIHAPALRAYGLFGDSGFDFDFDVMPQFGSSAGERHRALGYTVDFGYSPDWRWPSRVSVFYGYASGDHRPGDDRNQRFERFFGFARPWSANDYFQWENLRAPKLRLELQPHPRVRLDLGHSGYWLASDHDRWNNGNLRDRTGNSGDFIGHEFDARARLAVAPRADLTLGYALFAPGGFTRRVGRDELSHFFYAELLVRAFR